MDYFQEVAGDYLPRIGKKKFTRENIPRINAQVLANVVKAGIAADPSRQNLEFIPLFNFIYRDGHQMLSIGGLIGTQTHFTYVSKSEIVKSFYYRADFDKTPYQIWVPRITRRERLHHDFAMTDDENWSPDCFEIPPNDLRIYREIYRFLPVYAELLI
jgi:hypothetical protein